MTVRNRDTLLGHGQTALREVALGVVDAALSAMHPDTLVPTSLEREGDTLRVDGATYDLTAADRVTLLAAGKGSLHLARAVHDLLGGHVDDGVVVEKHGQGGSVPDCEVYEAGHPIPDETSLEAADAVLERADAAGADDLVVVCITGGASALLSAPADDLTLGDLRETSDRLLRAGVPIEDLNAVRKHCSRLKGGRLAARIAPARALTLVVVDEVAGDPWGPTVPDDTTYDDAVAALKRHGLWSGGDDASGSGSPGVEPVPERVRAHFRRSRRDPDVETPAPGSDAFEYPTQTVVLADGTTVCDAAADATPDGYPAHVLSTTVEGESSEVARAFGAVARECADAGRPFEPPTVLVSGGETTVTVGNERGTGGPNQEFALSIARETAGLDACTVVIDTDGTDGPTDVAGGVVDGTTAARAARTGVDIDTALRAHDTTSALRALDDVVVTGPTGTNVMDLRVTVLGP